MTHAAEAALPTIATIMKTQLAKIGVEVTVEVIDRPIFLRRLVTDRDWDQMLNFSGAALDTYSITRLIDTRAGNNTTNHDDKQVDALIDRIKEAATEEEYIRRGRTYNATWRRRCCTRGHHLALYPGGPHLCERL